MVMNKIFEMEFGSHVYGTNIATSDHDYKGLYIPAARDIVLGKTKETISTSTKPAGQLKNSAEDVDIELFSLKQYMKLLLEGQTVALTMLFCPPKHCLLSTPISRIIVREKTSWLHKGVSAFAGYCRQQANKYGIKGSRVAAARHAVDFFSMKYWKPDDRLRDHWNLIETWFKDQEHCEFLVETMKGHAGEPKRMLSVCNRKVQENIKISEALKIYTHLFSEYGARALQAENNENVDWKACMHAVRVAGEAKELLLDHHITYPRPDAATLVKIRLGELPYQQVAEMIENGLMELEESQAKSTLPEKPDYDRANDLVYSVYKDVICKQQL